MSRPKNKRIYYFLGNITSHILHALPLYKELGGTFIVLSERAKKEIEKYNVPVINIDDKPYRWQRFGYRIKPFRDYLALDKDLAKTSHFLNDNADIVLFYELYDFAPEIRLTNPLTVFLTHGNMLKDYMGSNDRLRILEQYDYMAALGPYLKKQFIEKDGIDPGKLVDIGIARTDEIVNLRNKAISKDGLIKELAIDPKKPVFAYLPTFWGPSSIYNTGVEIVTRLPKDYTLIFRPHPQTPQKILRPYFQLMASKPQIIYAPEGKFKSLDLVSLFELSDVMIGDLSSVMLDAILTKKPLIFAYDSDKQAEQKEDYRPIRRLVEKSGAISSDNAQQIPHVLAAALKNKIDAKTYDQTIHDMYFHADGSSIKAIVDFIGHL